MRIQTEHMCCGCINKGKMQDSIVRLRMQGQSNLCSAGKVRENEGFTKAHPSKAFSIRVESKAHPQALQLVSQC